jgi:acyl-CoA dehydrogenase
VPHARIHLQEVAIDTASLLPGDGYSNYVKPFRTLEDTFVTAAALAYLLREARARGWPADLRERLSAALSALAMVAQSHRDAPTTHVALAGALHWAAALYDEAGALWATTPEDPASRRWLRDAPLFAVAASALASSARRAPGSGFRPDLTIFTKRTLGKNIYYRLKFPAMRVPQPLSVRQTPAPSPSFPLEMHHE